MIQNLTAQIGRRQIDKNILMAYKWYPVDGWKLFDRVQMAQTKVQSRLWRITQQLRDCF